MFKPVAISGHKALLEIKFKCIECKNNEARYGWYSAPLYCALCALNHPTAQRLDPDTRAHCLAWIADAWLGDDKSG